MCKDTTSFWNKNQIYAKVVFRIFPIFALFNNTKMPIGIPIWMIVVSLLTGLAAATLLYVRNKKQHYGKVLNAILFALRTMMVGIVVLLLFNPLIRQKFSSVETPTILLAHDNSSSIVLCKDSAFYKNEYLTQFEQ